MATYLEFFELKKAPFDSRGQGRLVLGTQALRDALGAIKDGLRTGSPRICVSGGKGVGKTSLALALPRLLGESVHVVAIRKPRLPWSAQAEMIRQQLKLGDAPLSPENLIAARGDTQAIVLVIDTAEELPGSVLEELDAILAHRDENNRPIVQCVLLANLGVATDGSDVPLLWWLDQLTTLQLEFAPIPEQGVASYIEKHLGKAGWTGETLFTDNAALAIHRHSGGVPLAIGQLCDRVLQAAGERGCQRIEADLVEEVCGEPSPPAEAPPEPADAARPDRTSTARSSATGRPRPREVVSTAPPSRAAAGSPSRGKARKAKASLPDLRPAMPITVATESLLQAMESRTPRGWKTWLGIASVALFLGGSASLFFSGGDDSKPASLSPALATEPGKPAANPAPSEADRSATSPPDAHRAPAPVPTPESHPLAATPAAGIADEPAATAIPPAEAAAAPPLMVTTASLPGTISPSTGTPSPDPSEIPALAEAAPPAIRPDTPPAETPQATALAPAPAAAPTPIVVPTAALAPAAAIEPARERTAPSPPATPPTVVAAARTEPPRELTIQDHLAFALAADRSVAPTPTPEATPGLVIHPETSSSPDEAGAPHPTPLAAPQLP